MHIMCITASHLLVNQQLDLFPQTISHFTKRNKIHVLEIIAINYYCY